jgi:thiol-disulfide isomerase/thioredoxin
VFKVPEGAKQVKSLFEDEEEGEPVETLEGKLAPEFTLDLLDGGKVTVPMAKTNESVVVLDFWATWSGPCRRTLPVVAKLTREYKDKGMLYYAVNQQEQPDQVKAFLEKEGITCAVAMDVEGKVGQAYQMQGIPQTVLIGKDGTVQAIHIGLIPDMEKTLRGQLDVLVTGKSLIGK